MELMQQTKVKAEIQSLAAIAPDYLTSIYLPNKLRYGGWVWAQCCHSVDLPVNCWSWLQNLRKVVYATILPDLVGRIQI